MDYTQLQHGDVLIYEHKSHQSFLVRAIRLITGSKFVHAAVVVKVNEELYILEQQQQRMHSRIDFYYAFVGEVIHCVRPKFEVDTNINILDFYRENYGYINILDCLLNHTVSILTLKHWVFKPILVKLFRTKTIVCSALVAKVINLFSHAAWCKHITTIEPDDYYNHKETFDYLGIVVWPLKDDTK